ncbi:MAG: hypothetical protein C4527_23785 [Candidatus Omnitrophota bacterium]|jgi:hypothetical protein|nr:MAG: hypothetical protein C4527_23785 [Candidatus Omnitrophota bacterium]
MKVDPSKTGVHSRTLLLGGFAYYLGQYEGLPLALRLKDGRVILTGQECEIVGPIIKVERSESNLLNHAQVNPNPHTLIIEKQTVRLTAYEGPQMAIRLQDGRLLLTSRDCEIIGAVEETI